MFTWMFVSAALAADPTGNAAAGKTLYTASCTACHGVAGDGKGPAAIALKPKPADFTAPGWFKDRTDVQLVTSIRAGRPGTAMAPFTELTDAEVADLVAYLRTFSK